MFWLYATPIEGMFFLFSDAFLVMNLVRSVEESALLEEAHTDFLTGVMSRRQFSRLAQKALRQGPCSILILDIDHFKAVNDQFGHAVGDTVLRELGSICQQEAGQSDLVGRLGGDEFAILVTSTEDAARSVATRISSAFGLKCQSMGWPASISIGMAGKAYGPAALEPLIGQADQQLYNAKGRRPRTAA
jgi:diguanylate cyclase (GGDEF)-like protein